MFQCFPTYAQSVSLFLTKYEKYFNFSDKKCFTYFDKIQEVFQFFLQNAKIVQLFFAKMQNVFRFFQQKRKSVSICSTLCEKYLIFFEKMRKVFNFFRQNTTSVSFFSKKSEKFSNFFKPYVNEKCSNVFLHMRKVFRFF